MITVFIILSYLSWLHNMLTLNRCQNCFLQFFFVRIPRMQKTAFRLKTRRNTKNYLRRQKAKIFLSSYGVVALYVH